tara:strand:+ start:115 stop:555 length:441 start_codon:yes stop_codon:yes gene_type:complete
MENLLLRLYPTAFRRCKICKRVRSIENFSVGRYDMLDKNGKHYRRHECKEDELKRKTEERIERTTGRREAIKSDLACTTCGYSKKTHPSFVINALEFHHHENNKSHNVSDMWNMPYDEIVKEIEKTQVLCVRCHAEVTVNKKEKTK